MSPKGVMRWLGAATTIVARVATAAPDAAPEAASTSSTAPLTDAELAAMSETIANEEIVIYEERHGKPFDRDTVARLTGEQAIERGAIDLATALALLPDVQVQPAGRGGANVIIRGASKSEVSVLIDGVLVTDPYYGTFDLTSIPITDIVEIRISTTPQSPIDGPGGPGGVIEVHTRDAIGPQLVIARMTGSSLPSFGFSGGMRTMLSQHLALRVAAATLDSGNQFAISAPYNQIDQALRDASGLARLEYRDGDRRVALDGFVDDRHYVVPPSDDAPAFLLVDRETNARVSLRADDKIDNYQIQAETWFHYLHRLSDNFATPAQPQPGGLEDLEANREGGMVLVTHPIGTDARWVASTTVDRDGTNTGALTGPPSTGAITVIESAGDLQYEHKTIRLDGAAGVAVPFGLSTDAWPEGKGTARWRPGFGPIELTATVGHKGRVPSLRERFEQDFGNPALKPEYSDSAELRAVANVDERLHVELAPYYRHVEGLINPSLVPADMGRFANFPTIDLHGVDAIGRVQIISRVEVGGAYEYVLAHSVTTGDDPIAHLPHNRAEAWAKLIPIPTVSALTRVVYYGDSLNQAYKLAAYTTVEANVSWQASRKYLVVLHADDILDRRPEILPRVFGPGRVVSLMLQGTWD